MKTMRTVTKASISQLLKETARRLREAEDDEDDSLDDLGDDDAGGDDGGEGDDAGGDDAPDDAGNQAQPVSAAPAETGDSLDSQVDRYLTDYEREAGGGTGAVPTAMPESFSFRDMTRSFLLREAPDPNPTAISAAGGTSPTAGQVAGFNVEGFANSVIRLVNNYDNLIEVKNTLIKRATNFLAKGGHGDDVLEQFKAILRDQHGVEADKTDLEMDAEFQAPPADRAGPGQ
jgi:hypothetical protein